MADIQINATGGDVTEQTSIQIRRGSTATDSPPVEDDVEQFSAHEREELTETGVSHRAELHSNCIEGIQLYLVVFFTVGHSSIPPYSEAVLHCSVRTTGGRALPSSGLLEGLTLFAEETGLIVGRTLVDPSGWKVPVLVSNFSQETVVVNPFTEVGMIAQVTAIQSVTDDRLRLRSVTRELPHHLRDLVDQTSGDLDGDQRRQLAEVLLEYADIFPVPGDPLTGHTDAVEHDINTGDLVTHPVCPTSHVTPEDEEGRRLCHRNADRRPD